MPPDHRRAAGRGRIDRGPWQQVAWRVSEGSGHGIRRSVLSVHRARDQVGRTVFLRMPVALRPGRRLRLQPRADGRALLPRLWRLQPGADGVPERGEPADQEGADRHRRGAARVQPPAQDRRRGGDAGRDLERAARPRHGARLPAARVREVRHRASTRASPGSTRGRRRSGASSRRRTSPARAGSTASRTSPRCRARPRSRVRRSGRRRPPRRPPSPRPASRATTSWRSR